MEYYRHINLPFLSLAATLRSLNVSMIRISCTCTHTHMHIVLPTPDASAEICHLLQSSESPLIGFLCSIG